MLQRRWRFLLRRSMSFLRGNAFARRRKDEQVLGEVLLLFEHVEGEHLSTLEYRSRGEVRLLETLTEQFAAELQVERDADQFQSMVVFYARQSDM